MKIFNLNLLEILKIFLRILQTSVPCLDLFFKLINFFVILFRQGLMSLIENRLINRR